MNHVKFSSLFQYHLKNIFSDFPLICSNFALHYKYRYNDITSKTDRKYVLVANLKPIKWPIR